MSEKRDVDTDSKHDHHSRTSNEGGIPSDASSENIGGAQIMEASHQVYGKYSKWFLFLGLGLASYIYSLDSATTWTYLAFATSAFRKHSLLASVEVAKGLIIAVGKPIIAKISDVSSRGIAYSIVLSLYVIGYIILATSKNVGTIAGGTLIYACGYTGLQLLTQVVVADISSLRWRGLIQGLLYSPFLVNAWIGANISAGVMAGGGWRWGYGMFAILVPAALFPLIATLIWAQRKADRLGLIAKPPVDELPLKYKVREYLLRLNVSGLVLLGTGLALVLLPLTLTENAVGKWKNASIIAMIVCGFVILGLFIAHDVWYAPHPVVPKRFLKNRAFLASCVIGFFDFLSFYLTYVFLYSFIMIIKPWNQREFNYFGNAQTVALTFFGILGGVVMYYTHRYKWLLFVGLLIRIFGVGLMIHSRGANGNDVELVFTQLIQGLGGGIAAVCSQVGAQASVKHADVATLTAVVLLFTEIGGAVGGAIGGAIWVNTMPKNLAKYLPFATEAEREQIFASVVAAGRFPRGHPVREGTILAYGESMKVILIVACVVSIVPIVASLFMPNYYLGDQQNAVDNSDLKGNKHAAAPPPESEKTPAARDQPPNPA